MEVEFREWPKIPRIKDNTITISEKIDGTNACIIILGGKMVGVQSRTRLITRESDNFGFANWAYDNEEALTNLLGEGYHYGEWAGPGIQKNPHNLDKKYLFLFNTHKQDNGALVASGLPVKLVPLLYQGPYDPSVVDWVMEELSMRAKIQSYTPEGIIVYFHDTRVMQKATFANPEGKWKNI